MKKYRVVVIDFNKYDNRRKCSGVIVSERYATGIVEARKIAPFKVNYYNNVKCFSGWKDNINCIICEV